jgi:heme-degrading monooxygenase HmoA
VPKLRELEGYVGATVLTRRADREVEILVATLWRSMEAIHQFAGSDVEAAVVAEEAAALLTEVDRRVRHFEVVSTDQLEGSFIALMRSR